LGPWPVRDDGKLETPAGEEVHAIDHAPNQEQAQEQEQPPRESLPPPRGRRWKWVGILLLLLLVALAAFYYRYYRARRTGQASRLQEPSGVGITVASAKKGNIGVYLEAIGTVTPVYTVNITPQVNGVVTAVHYVEGQMVKKGDPLIDIDPRQYAAQVLQAQGTLERDLNVLAQSKMDLARFRDAWARNAIARQQLEDQEKLVLQNEGLVKSDQGNLQFLQVQLDWCHITAPIAGRLGLRLVDPGNVVQATPATQPGTNSTTAISASSLVIITQVQPITVIFTIAQDYLGDVRDQLRKGITLPVQALDRTSQTRLGSGTVLAIDNQIDTTTGTFKVRANFENAEDKLFPNQFVNVRLLARTLRGVTLIPTNAIQHNGQQAFVFVVRDDITHLQPIKTGITESGVTAVEGIHPRDVVATSSFERLQDGSHVTIVRNAQATHAGGSHAP
jgi:multidrug efflux system membrane fusion protein